MKLISILTTSLVTLSIASAALAHDGGKNGRHGGGFMKGEPVTFAEIDTNSDGQITVEEITALKATRFAEADTDGNGELSLEELTAKSPDGNADRAAEMLERHDSDNSGGLSVDEMTGPRDDGDRAQKMIERMDTDGDGQISQAEFDAAPKRGSKDKSAPAPSADETQTPSADDSQNGST